ncbi:MAG: MBL fold metallo-hydrolase [Deltaproteobacteria bacterium]|nr:MBL fold metallo-hydrolase [Deltaproteobacteria bacterium]
MNRLCATFLEGASVILEFGGSVRLLTNPRFKEKSKTDDSLIDRLSRLTGLVITAFEPGQADLSAPWSKTVLEAPVVVPRGFVWQAELAGFSTCHELAAGESVGLGPIRLTATPAAPADGRFSAIIEAFGFTVFFAGETLFEPLLGAVPKSFPKIDLAFLPVGGPAFSSSSRPKTLMSAQEAAGLCAVLRPRTAIPILWEADPTSPAAFITAAKIFAPATKIKILKYGESVCL